MGGGSPSRQMRWDILSFVIWRWNGVVLCVMDIKVETCGK